MASLTISQITFLENNFVVFDPETEQTYKEFGALQESKVVLIGETHHTIHLIDIQNQFLKYFGGAKSCLLVEGLPPGQSLTKDEVVWRDIPEGMDILGSDCRKLSSVNNSRRWFECQKKIIELDRQNIPSFRDSFRSVAKVVNREIQSGNGKIGDGEMVLPHASYQKISELREAFRAKMEEWDQAFNLLEAEQGKITEAAERGTKEEQSTLCNRVLLHTIKKTAEQYEKVFVIYGEGHFCGGQELLEDLEKEKIPFVVLLPNQERNREAKKERKLQKGKMRHGNFKVNAVVSDKVFTRELTIPRIFQDLYLPSIQDLFVYEEKPQETILYLNSSDISEIFQERDYCEFPANTTIKICGFDSAHYHAMDNIVGKNQEQITKILELIFNDLLLFSRAKVKALTFKEKRILGVEYNDRKYWLTLRSPNPFSLTIERGKMQTSARFLFREMKRRKLPFLVKAKETIFFTDLTDKDQLKDFSLLIQLLSQKAAREIQIDFEGETMLFDDDDSVSITSNQDFSFLFKS